MFYRRFWARGEIRSTDGFRVIPMGERGIIYYDESGSYFINAAVAMHCKPNHVAYEVSPNDVFAATPANRSGDPKIAIPLAKRKEVLQRAGEAVRYSGADWLER